MFNLSIRGIGIICFPNLTWRASPQGMNGEFQGWAAIRNGTPYRPDPLGRPCRLLGYRKNYGEQSEQDPVFESCGDQVCGFQVCGF